jgi:hypothetical protein
LDAVTIFSRKEYQISEANRTTALRIALIASGAIFNFGIYPLGIVWLSGWTGVAVQKSASWLPRVPHADF